MPCYGNSNDCKSSDSNETDHGDLPEVHYNEISDEHDKEMPDSMYNEIADDHDSEKLESEDSEIADNKYSEIADDHGPENIHNEVSDYFDIDSLNNQYNEIGGIALNEIDYDNLSAASLGQTPSSMDAIDKLVGNREQKDNSGKRYFNTVK